MKKPVKKVTPAVRSARHAAALKAARTRATRKVTPAVRAARHIAAVKAARTRVANKAKPRQLSPGVAVACCSAAALAASLRLSGHAVSGQDVLELYWHTASDPDTGASIQATLEAAAEFGLAGVRPVSFQGVSAGALGFERQDASPVNDLRPDGLLLGVELPGPHAVLDTGCEWITWGEAWPVTVWPDVVIEEAWEVTWPGSPSALPYASPRPSAS